jgi:Fanconi anemia group M protein
MKITADYRERRSGIIELLQDQCHVEIECLACGDYRINNHILVERKTARDLLLSIVDHRFFRQIKRIKNVFYRTLMIIEGNPYITDLNFSPEAVKGALLSCQVVWQLPVHFTGSVEETADTLVAIGRQAEKHDDVVLLRSGYRPKRLRSRQLYFLQGLPGVGPVLANRMLEHFGSPAKMSNSSLKELASVSGVGMKRASSIREVLDEEYE